MRWGSYGGKEEEKEEGEEEEVAGVVHSFRGPSSLFPLPRHPTKRDIGEAVEERRMATSGWCNRFHDGQCGEAYHIAPITAGTGMAKRWYPTAQDFHPSYSSGGIAHRRSRNKESEEDLSSGWWGDKERRPRGDVVSVSSVKSTWLCFRSASSCFRRRASRRSTYPKKRRDVERTSGSSTTPTLPHAGKVVKINPTIHPVESGVAQEEGEVPVERVEEE